MYHDPTDMPHNDKNIGDGEKLHINVYGCSYYSFHADQQGLDGHLK